MINENYNEDFKDFGKTDWYNSDKGFGVANTLNNKSIFIYKTNINKTPNKGDRVIIRVYCKPEFDLRFTLQNAKKG